MPFFKVHLWLTNKTPTKLGELGSTVRQSNSLLPRPNWNPTHNAVSRELTSSLPHLWAGEQPERSDFHAEMLQNKVILCLRYAVCFPVCCASKLHSKHLSRLMMLQVLFKRSDFETLGSFERKREKKHKYRSSDLVAYCHGEKSPQFYLKHNN